MFINDILIVNKFNLSVVEYTKNNVMGLVTLYNSKLQVVNNIQSYINQVDHLIIIDNSETVNFELAKQIKMIYNITYIQNGNNLGVAYALNQAADIAVEAGYQFILTMDDDTYFPMNGVQKMLDFVNQYEINKLGIVASQSDPKLFNDSIKLVPYTITSGSLLNLSAYKKCGRFLSELFIDFVDHEYCFRLKEHGYNVIEINYIQLNHSLGLQKQLSFLKIKLPIYWTSHNPLRIYYKTRNCVFSLKKYTLLEIRVKYIFFKVIIKDLLKIIFFEDKKQIRILLFIKGLYDGLIGNLGKRTFEF